MHFAVEVNPKPSVSLTRVAAAYSHPQQLIVRQLERHNLTIRTFTKRFARLSLGFSKKLDNLAAAVSIYMAYYNFCWRPRHTDYSGQPGRLRPTPAMAADVTGRLWKLDDLFSEVSARYLSS